MPSFTDFTISVSGIPAMRPIAIAPTSIEIIAWTLYLMMRSRRMMRPINAPATKRVESNITPSICEKASLIVDDETSYVLWNREIISANIFAVNTSFLLS